MEGHEVHEESALAARLLQSSILPKEVEIESLGISAGIKTAEVVGGDYYDLIPSREGCWIALGDVAGQGLAAGVIMMMIQSAVQSLVRHSPEGGPVDILCALNAALYENIRERMKREDDVTFCLARYSADGALVFAGAHEHILICRAGDGYFERVPAQGGRLGTARDVRGLTSETTLRLGAGDLMVMFTDGAIETRNANGEPFGADRLRAHLLSQRALPARQIRNSVMDALLAWNERPQDDITLVVVKGQDVGAAR